jgi:hypothetical protein
MKQYAESLREDFQLQLISSAIGYLDIGLMLFQDQLESPDEFNPQIPLGNVAISIELMLKSFVASKSLLLLFKGLSLESRVLLTCPESLPQNFRWRVADLDLRNATDKMIDLGESISFFLMFFPDLKQPLKSHFDFLASARNASVHSILPSFQKYELERAAYLALKIYETLRSAGVIDYDRKKEFDVNFLSSFQASTVERVQAKLKTAKDNAKRLSNEYVLIDLKSLPSINALDYWSRFVIDCPICGNDALLEGYTAFTAKDDSEGSVLSFLADRFKCDVCQLKLDDYDELRLTGIAQRYERDDDSVKFENAVQEVAEAEGW